MKTVVSACISASSFFVVMYSLSWGREKSLEWLFGMFLNIIQDIILIQPIKVVLTSIANATMHQLPNDGVEFGSLVFNRANSRRNVELFKRARGVLFGIFHHIVYAVITAMVIGTVINYSSFLQLKTLMPGVRIPKTNFRESTISYDQVFKWLDKQLLPNYLLGNQVEFGLNFKTSEALYRNLQPNVVMLGPFRLRQQRVPTSVCPLNKTVLFPEMVARFIPNLEYPEPMSCQESFSTGLGAANSDERRAFNGSWAVPIETPFDRTNLSDWEGAWAYRDSSGMFYNGFEASYSTGGFYVNLPRTLTKAKQFVKSLKQSKWLDNATTVLFVEFNLFNPQTNIFVPVRVAFEALSAGSMSYHIRMFPLQLYQYYGASSILVFIIQGLWVVLLISHLVRLGRQLKKEGKKRFFSSGWNILDLVQALLGLTICTLFIVRIAFIMDKLAEIKTMQSEFVSLDLLAYWEDVIFCLIGVEFFIILMLFFRHLSFNKYWAVFMGTLSSGTIDIVTYVCVFTSMTMFFGALAFLVMGKELLDFSSFTRSMMSLIKSLIMSNKFSIYSSKFHLALSMVYTAVVVFLGSNIFVTLLMSAYGDVSCDVEKKTNWDNELSGYLAESVKGMFKRKPRWSNEKEEQTAEQPKDKSKCFFVSYYYYFFLFHHFHSSGSCFRQFHQPIGPMHRFSSR